MNRVDLDHSVGYALKRAQSALRAAMDLELREHELSVPQYACLELLCQRPGISNAELARGVFVTRQATHQLLAGLRRSGLVDSTGNGRNERISPTADGESRLLAASKAVKAIEERMLAQLSDAQRERLQADLTACAESLAAIAERGGG